MPCSIVTDSNGVICLVLGISFFSLGSLSLSLAWNTLYRWSLLVVLTAYSFHSFVCVCMGPILPMKPSSQFRFFRVGVLFQPAGLYAFSPVRIDHVYGVLFIKIVSVHVHDYTFAKFTQWNKLQEKSYNNKNANNLYSYAPAKWNANLCIWVKDERRGHTGIL